MSEPLGAARLLARLRAENARLRADHDASFALYHRCMVRAQEAWRAQHPEASPLLYPDGKEAWLALMEENERLRADAELGAMVRRMPEAYSLEHAAAHMPEAWVVRDWMDTAMAVCDTPDAALRAAGLGEEEQP